MKNRLRNLTLPLAAAALIFGSCSSNDEPVIPQKSQGTTQTPGNKDPEPEQPAPAWELLVAQDGSGDYATVQEAIDALPNNGKPHIVYIKAGTYREKITVRNHRNTILVGEDAATTVLTWDDCAGTIGPNGQELGTQNSASLTISSTDFMAVNLTIENSHKNDTGQGDQAVAVGAYSDRTAFYNCRLVGYQDTFYVKNNGRVYCKDCYIEGNVDFIFGDAVLLCENCRLHCNRNDSVVTAAADHSKSRFGFVFADCTLTHIEGSDFTGKPFSTFHLGRPWKAGAQVVFIRCDEPAALAAAGWRRMSAGVEAGLFAEYQCTGAGAAADRLAQRQMGGCQLTDAEAAEYTIENIFAAACNPEKYDSDWTPAAKVEIAIPDGE